MEIKAGMKNLWSIAGGPALEPLRKDKTGWWCKWHDGKSFREDLFINEELTTEDPNEPELEEDEAPKKRRSRD